MTDPCPNRTLLCPNGTCAGHCASVAFHFGRGIVIFFNVGAIYRQGESQSRVSESRFIKEYAQL